MSESRSLGEAIRLRRLDLGMSQEELAERIGPDVRQSDVSRLERGKIVFPRLERLNQIASALGISTGALLVEAGWFSDEESTPTQPPVIPALGRSVSILIADDEPISLEAMVSLLADSGYSVGSAYDFESLVQQLAESSPALVLVDIALPGLKPEWLVAQPVSRDSAPLFVYMGVGLPDLEIDRPYLEKPIDSRQLLAFIGAIDTRRDGAPHTDGRSSGRKSDLESGLA